MQIIGRRFILGRSLLEDVLAKARKENEDRVGALCALGLKAKIIFHEKDLTRKDPIGLEVSLGNFKVDRETVDKTLKYSLWGKVPVAISKDTEFFLECREYAPQHNYNKVFCSPKGEELTEGYDYGSNYASYLHQDEATEIVICNNDYLKINRCFIESSPQGDSVRVSKTSIWKGPIINFPKSIHREYTSALKRCFNNLHQKPAEQNVSVVANNKNL